MGSSADSHSSALEHSPRGRAPHKDFFSEDRALPRPSEQAHVAGAREGSVNSRAPVSSPKNLDYIASNNRQFLGCCDPASGTFNCGGQEVEAGARKGETTTSSLGGFSTGPLLTLF